MKSGFEKTLDYIRNKASSEKRKGELFEQLMKAFFEKDSIYSERFTKVWLWQEWAVEGRREAGLDPTAATDIGIDLVAKEANGEFCAIQCKCYDSNTTISKKHIDSFIAASNRKPYTSRLMVDTGADWGPNALKTISGLATPCQLLRFNDLAERENIEWPDLVSQSPDALNFSKKVFKLRPHQKIVFDDTIEGFKGNNRGKVIMACGTGKTFTSLRIAEKIAGERGRVLYLVPSISLVQQAMREWADNKGEGIRHSYICVCSDSKVSKATEDVTVEELEIPVTTDPTAIREALSSNSNAMKIVFSTYHSIEQVEKAQQDGAPGFDLAICDEAHRTTGIERINNKKISYYQIIHDKDRIHAKKRLYMTATPRIYTEQAKSKAGGAEIGVYSMDDKEVYGPQFHRLPFSKAIEQNLLSDYKVVILTISEEYANSDFQNRISDDEYKINVTDSAKIVGCWRALHDPEDQISNGKSNELSTATRAIAFSTTIKDSKRLEHYWSKIVDEAAKTLPENHMAKNYRCKVRHVDGKDNALFRKAQIDWLKQETPGSCRLLTNARCLSEGIDVPALDAVLFMNTRSSVVDIVQAVGRTMRKTEGKDYGYIILPITIPPDVSADAALDKNQEFKIVWEVLRALRSHDDRMDAMINKIDLNINPPEKIIIHNGGITNDDGQIPFPFPPLEVPAEALFAKIVEHCGDKRYWEYWAKDVAEIFSRLVFMIDKLLDEDDNTKSNLVVQFQSFHNELKKLINDTISINDTMELMAQHILTKPVFDALYDDYDFAANNPVSKNLDRLHSEFKKYGLDYETRNLESFYESVRKRAQELDNFNARQQVLMELYEKFFKIALKKASERLGIVYTPHEVVDFILHSADAVLKQEFGRGISNEDVHVLDPFAGTGVFISRLIQSKQLIKDDDIKRKYSKELHANEILLLAYYIAIVHIEESFHERMIDKSNVEPFPGMVFTDTFNQNKKQANIDGFLSDNSKRVFRQEELPIEVIVGNPPWSAGQRSAADNNPNTEYTELENRISETYVANTSVTNKNSLYDSYKMAIRWSSDRIKNQGVLAFVTNGSWLEGMADSGVRACLAKEFSSIYVLNLRGNARTSGERFRQEGGKIFGSGSRAPVSISVFVKNPDNTNEKCKINYKDIGDYLKRDQKLQYLKDTKSITNIDDLKQIIPDKHNDWLRQRDPSFDQLLPIASKDVKAGKSDKAVFKLYSLGLITGRDAYLYNFSELKCSENAHKAVKDYMGAFEKFHGCDKNMTGGGGQAVSTK